MTDGTQQNREGQKADKQLEAAIQADDQATKNYHIREALQYLRIAGETSSEETDAE